MSELQIADISKGVVVPVVPRPDVSLPREYERVKQELGNFKQQLVDADSPLLAGQIRFGENDENVHVRYNPKKLGSMESVEPLTLEQECKFLYGEYANRGGGENAMLGLTDFSIKPDGELTVSTFKEKRGKGFWSPPQQCTPDLLNQALKGLVGQHEDLLADRLRHSVVGVTVPLVGST